MTSETPEFSPLREFLAGRSAAAALLAWVLFLATAAMVVLVPIRADNDCWWHVKSGQYIREHGLPEKDIFNYMAESYDWHNHEWLFQMGMHWAYEIAADSGLGVIEDQDGWRGVVLFCGLFIIGAYTIAFLLTKKITGNWWLALLIVVWAIAIGRRTFYPRPPVVSYLIMMGLILLFTAYSEGWLTRKRWLLLLLPVFALWTNLHGAWLAGGIIVGCYLLQDLVEAVRCKLCLPFEETPRILTLPQWMGFGVLIVLATMLNPYTWQLYLLPVRVMSDPQLTRTISELQSPDFYFVQHFEYGFLIPLVLALLLPRFRARTGELLLFLFFVHQGIQHVRHLTLFSFAMIPLMARLFRALLDSIASEEFPGVTLLRRVRDGVIIIAVLLVTAVLLRNPREGLGYPERFHHFVSGLPQSPALGPLGYMPGAFPDAACDFIVQAELKGRMFHGNGYSGYLLWRLSPERHKVFTDSRFDIFASDILATESAILSGADFFPDPENREQTLVNAWRVLLDRHDVQWALIPGEAGLAEQFRRAATDDAPPWVLAAHWWPAPSMNAQAGLQLWIRNTEENQEMIRRATELARRQGLITPSPGMMAP